MVVLPKTTTITWFIGKKMDGAEEKLRNPRTGKQKDFACAKGRKNRKDRPWRGSRPLSLAGFVTDENGRFSGRC
jgi:hypothetical protein